MFIGDLRASYYDMLDGNAMKNFINMVITSDMMDDAIKSGKQSIR